MLLFVDKNLYLLFTFACCWGLILIEYLPRISWKRKSLSFDRRICLIKNMLNSLPNYFMSIILMPKGVYNILNSIQRRFLCAGVTKQRAIYEYLGSVK